MHKGNVRGSGGSYIKHYKLAGLGLHKVNYEISRGEDSGYLIYYETGQERKKTSGEDDPYPRIISVEETAYAGNNSFRCSDGEDSKMKVTAIPTGRNGKAYGTLYDLNGTMLKQTKGVGTLTLSIALPENGFHYIITMIDQATS